MLMYRQFKKHYSTKVFESYQVSIFTNNLFATVRVKTVRQVDMTVILLVKYTFETLQKMNS